MSCNCKLCKRNNKYMSFVKLIKDEKIKKYFETILNYILEIENDNDWYDYKNKKRKENRIEYVKHREKCEICINKNNKLLCFACYEEKMFVNYEI